MATSVTCVVRGPIKRDKTAKPEGRHYGYLDGPSAKGGLGSSINLTLNSVGALKGHIDIIPSVKHNDEELA